jgi:pentapeptide MXKDX repeat protein
MKKLVLAAACCFSLLSLARADEGSMEHSGAMQHSDSMQPDHMKGDQMKGDQTKGGHMKGDGMTKSGKKAKPKGKGSDDSTGAMGKMDDGGKKM